jgi:hypothetical protein
MRSRSGVAPGGLRSTPAPPEFALDSSRFRNTSPYPQGVRLAAQSVFPMKIVLPCRERTRCAYNGAVFDRQKEIPD